jgi:hypothetical protein
MPDEGEKVLLALSTRRGGGGDIDFTWGSLVPGSLLTDDGPKSRSEWLDYTIEGCGGT